MRRFQDEYIDINCWYFADRPVCWVLRMISNVAQYMNFRSSRIQLHWPPSYRISCMFGTGSMSMSRMCCLLLSGHFLSEIYGYDNYQAIASRAIRFSNEWIHRLAICLVMWCLWSPVMNGEAFDCGKTKETVTNNHKIDYLNYTGIDFRWIFFKWPRPRSRSPQQDERAMRD